MNCKLITLASTAFLSLLVSGCITTVPRDTLYQVEGQTASGNETFTGSYKDRRIDITSSQNRKCFLFNENYDSFSIKGDLTCDDGMSGFISLDKVEGYQRDYVGEGYLGGEPVTMEIKEHQQSSLWIPILPVI